MGNEDTTIMAQPGHLHPLFKCLCPVCSVVIEEGPGVPCLGACCCGCIFTLFFWVPKTQVHPGGGTTTVIVVNSGSGSGAPIACIPVEEAPGMVSEDAIVTKHVTETEMR